MKRLFRLPILLLVLGGQAQAGEDVKPGHIRFPSGAQVIVGPESATGWIAKLEKQLNKHLKRDPKDVFKNLGNASKSATWTIPIVVPYSTSPDKIPAICEDYIAYFFLPRVRAIPPKIKNLQLKVSLKGGEVERTCSHRVEGQRVISENSDTPINPALNFRRLDLGDIGYVMLAQTSVLRRLDMEKPILEYIMIVPKQKHDGIEISQYVERSAKYLYSKSKGTSNFAFVIGQQGSTPSAFKPTGLRRIAVRTQDNSILQINNIKFGTGRTISRSAVKLSPKDFSVQVYVDNTSLARHMKSKTVDEYVKVGIYGDSRLYMKLVGEYAAKQWNSNNVIIISNARTGKRGMRMSFPVVFAKRGEEWIAERPKK